MTAPSSPRPSTDEIQFDHAASPDAGAACSTCGAAIRLYYYHADGQVICPTCRQAAERGGKSGGLTGALLYGIGAMIAGAGVYYGFIAITGWEVGYVAILIGFMVGWAVRKGASGSGGRRYQFLALGLTYFAIALAYAPLAFEGAMSADPTTSIEELDPDSLTAVATTDGLDVDDVADTDADADLLDEADASEAPGAGMAAVGIGALFLLVFALPIIVVIGSLPSGIISALIIGVGMLQAWNMTGGDEVAAAQITGPYRLGSAPPRAA